MKDHKEQYNVLDKNSFYNAFIGFENKHLPININIPINKNTPYIYLSFYWNSQTINGKFNPIMTASLIDIRNDTNILNDLVFDCVKEKITTDYKLYKKLNDWILEGLKNELQ